MQSRFLRTLVIGVSLFALGACSSGPTSRIDYKEAKSLPTLEMPPDLSHPEEIDRARLPQSGHSSVAGQARSILPLADGIRIERDRSTRWLVVDGSAEQLWPRLVEFWSTIGLELHREELTLGIMETEWAENRADIPSGFIAGLIRSVVPKAYSAGTRDKYRLRLEPLENGKTEIYLTHYGLHEQFMSRGGEFVDMAWATRPSDPELGHELLNRIIIHLGGSQEQAAQVLQRDAERGEAASRVRLDADVLLVSEGLSRTWRRTGIALDEAGLVVKDRNLSEGVYYVTAFDSLADSRASRGWLRNLFTRDGEAEDIPSFRVILSGDEQATRIVVRDAEGGVLPQQEAVTILQKLAELLQ